MKSSWAFYNSDGEIVGGFEGAWKFFNSNGEPLSSFVSSIAAHASTHENGGSDEITIENLGTGEVDTTLVLAPDGLGGVEFRADAGGGGSAWSILTTGSLTGELIFAGGDVIETEVCNGAACS